MSDNITLPREVVVQAVKVLSPMAWDTWPRERNEVVEALRTALAAPRPEPVAWMRKEWSPDCGSYFDLCAEEEMGWRDRKEWTPLYAAPPAAAPRPEPSGYAYRYADGVLRLNDGSQFNGGWPVEAVPYWFAPPAAAPEPMRHPGYLIGNHWLETAYSRVCAGEVEADVLRDCGWERVTDAEALRRENERLTDEQIDSATSKERDDLLDHIYEYGTAAEGILERIRKLARAAIDAAMDASAAPASAAVDALKEPATKPAIRARGEVPR